MRVLVTGASGQVGSDVVGVCEAAGDDVLAADRASLDVTDRGAVLGAVTSWRPEVVIHTAAWTEVDACEGDPDRADLHNGLAVRWVAEACHRVGAHLVHLSTDYVFDGTLDRPYAEHDVPCPVSAYGRSKAIGEREALALGPAAAVIRTSWLCGDRGTNVLKTVMRLAAAGDGMAFVDDQHGCPTFATDLAPALRRAALDRLSGVIHLTNAGATTWHRFAGDVVAAMGRDPSTVRAISTAELDPPRPAPRPANSVLDNSVWRASGHTELRDHRAPMRELVARLT